MVQANKQKSQRKTQPLNQSTDVSSKYFGKAAHSLSIQLTTFFYFKFWVDEAWPDM